MINKITFAYLIVLVAMFILNSLPFTFPSEPYLKQKKANLIWLKMAHLSSNERDVYLFPKEFLLYSSLDKLLKIQSKQNIMSKTQQKLGR